MAITRLPSALASLTIESAASFSLRNVNATSAFSRASSLTLRRGYVLLAVPSPAQRVRPEQTLVRNNLLGAPARGVPTHDCAVFKIGEINAAIWPFEHPIGCWRLPDVFHFRFQFMFPELFIREETCLDPVKCVTGECVIIEIAILRIECDAIGCDLRRHFLLLLD